MCSNETKTEKAGEKMVCKLKTIRADMLVLQCQLERELISDEIQEGDELIVVGQGRVIDGSPITITQ